MLPALAQAQLTDRNGGLPFRYTHNQLQFRLFAPNAKEVRLAGWDIVSYTGNARSGEKSFPGIPLRKDSAGTWTVTLPNMDPNPYQYFYWVDGVRTLDPGNRNTLTTYQQPFSVAEVTRPGKPAFWQRQAVPHGTVHHLTYFSQVLQTERPLVVYTPPGYETGRALYPVLYLLHGAGEIAGSWIEAGKANQIADNLIAQGRARPCLIVMPLGHPDGLDGRVDSNLLAGPHRFSWMEKELLENIIPLTERKFRARRDQRYRALAGLSMGAAQTTYIGLRHPNLFDYIGIFSAGDKNLRGNHAGFMSDPAKANRELKLLFLGVGDRDRVGHTPGEGESGIYHQCKNMSEQLSASGIRHRLRILPETDHTWYAWRRLLHDDFLPALWK
ncbi:esterase family protein [Flaviaesturariibacter amylovorans]|uniref:Esterase family protein n=1 Tax=Flaviaesturariibacter amylovorans TaxID=1084520 RepID=A0ABP8H6W8_9BACT